MVSLATVKVYLRITSTDATRDTLISTLIPVVYADIISECNNKFIATDYDISSSDIYFDVTGVTYKILLDAGGFTAMAYPTGGNIIVSGSRLNNSIYTISAQADTYLTTTEAIVDELQTTDGYSVRIDLCNFPKQLEAIASYMIKECLDLPGTVGLTSQRHGNYAETRAARTGSYSPEVLAKLRPWKNHVTGRGTIQWHMNENRSYFPSSPTSSEGDN
ncbi:MAG: hypothetical protein IMZ61_04720 [Planctomycetes bacterium]|nr:hypothetical protein [Planctomycetota bacterium]